MAVTIVAELGINHGGDLETALAMVDAAAEAGCDAVKVQAYDVNDFLPAGHPDWDLFFRCWLPRSSIAAIWERCRSHNLDFGATPTNAKTVDWLVYLGVDFLKNGSDFLPRHDLIRAMAETGLPVVLSTGMATEEEVLQAIDACHPTYPTVLICTSAYPCPDEDAKLGLLGVGRGPLHFVGYSDHTEGITAAIAAAALGATMIEKHFTLSKTAEGPDHAFSADPAEMTALVREVRRVETMRASTETPAPSEQEAREKWRVHEGRPRSG